MHASKFDHSNLILYIDDGSFILLFSFVDDFDDPVPVSQITGMHIFLRQKSLQCDFINTLL